MVDHVKYMKKYLYLYLIIFTKFQLIRQVTERSKDQRQQESGFQDQREILSGFLFEIYTMYRLTG